MIAAGKFRSWIVFYIICTFVSRLVSGTVKAAGSSSDLEIVFQNGLEGYAETREVEISTQHNASWNLYNGETYGVPYSPWNTLKGTALVGELDNGDQFRFLLKFANISKKLPSGSRVVAASLVLKLTTWTAVPKNLHGRYLNRFWEWDTNKAISTYNKVGWRFAAPTKEWAVPGALFDTHPHKNFTVSITETGNQTVEIPLDADVAQLWLNESNNHGVLLYMMEPSAVRTSVISITSNETVDRPFFPMLVLRVTPDTSGEGTTTTPLPNMSPHIQHPVRRTIYVDATHGNDYWNGHRLFPVKSLTTAVSICARGETILLRSGVYGGAQISLPNITIMSAPGQWGVISAPIYDPQVLTALFLRPGADGFHLRNVEVMGGYHYAIGTFSTWQWYPNHTSDSLYATGPIDALIEDCRIHSSGSSAIKLTVTTKNATIRRNVIHSAGRRVAVYGHGIEMVNNHGGQIVENYMYDLPGAGVKMSGGCKDVLIARNFIERAHLAGILMGFYEETEYMDLVLNGAKWYECIRCVAVSNIIQNINGAGIGFYASLNSFAAHNTLYSVAHTMMSAVVVSAVQHWVNGSLNGSPITANVGLEFKNNVVVLGNQARRGNMLLQIREASSWGSDGAKVGGVVMGSDFTSDYNLYHSLMMPTPKIFVWGDGAMLEDERHQSLFVGNITGWIAAKGWDAHSVDVDPRMRLDFFLSECSIGRNFAPRITMPNGKPILDFDGNPIEGSGSSLRVDLGARQSAPYTAHSSPPPPFPPLNALRRLSPYDGVGVYPGYSFEWPFYQIANRARKTFYVSPFGNDLNSGNITHPKKTTDPILTNMWPGDTLILRNGTYTEPLKIFHPNITIMSYPGEKVIISVSNADSNVPNAVQFSSGGNFGGAAEVTLRGLEIIGGYYYGVMFNQAGGGTSNPYWRWWKAMQGIRTSSVTIVEDCIIHESGSHLIKLSPESNDIIFRRLWMYNAGKRGEIPPAAPANVGSSVKNDGTLPTVQSNGNAGIQGGGFDIRNGNGILIQDCHIHHVSGSAILLGGGSINSVIERNLIRNVGGIGILIGSFSTEAQYMRLRDNPKLYQARGTVVRNNIVFHVDGAGLGLYSTKNTTVVHNSFINVAQKMQAAILFNVAPTYNSPLEELLPPNEDVMMVNNIFTQGADAAGYMLENRVWQSSTAAGVKPASVPNYTCTPGQAITSFIPLPTNVPKNSGLNGGCPIYPADNAWNQRIHERPLHPLNEQVMLRLKAPGCKCLAGNLNPCFPSNAPCGRLHPDFGGNVPANNGQEALAGIPFVLVNSSVPKRSIPFLLYGDESDNIPYPFPLDAPIEGTPSSGCTMDMCPGDRHVIAFDTDTCLLYEVWRAELTNSGAGIGWQAANGAVFDLTSNELRPLGWTSADAAGLPIFVGLVKYDEVQRGEITHAIRVSFRNTRKAYVKPATHYASSDPSPYLPAMGHRFRLQSAFNCSNLRRSARIVCVALQQYGAIVADNGMDWFLSGEAHPQWNFAELQDVKLIPAHFMELVYTGDECLNPECKPIPVVPASPWVSAIRDLTKVFLDGNVYWKDPGTNRKSMVEFVDRDPSHFWRSIISKLDGWQNHTGKEQRSIIGDPKLNPAFQISTESSVAFWGGRSIAHLATEYDFFGKPRRVGANFEVDIGAVSYNYTNLNSLRDVPGGLYPTNPSILFQDPCVGQAIGSTVYVDPRFGSDDSCAGTLQAPFATLQIALRRVHAQSRIILQNGTYDVFPGVRIGKDGITILGNVSKGRIRIQSSPLGGLDAISILGDNITLENLEVVGGSMSTISLTGQRAQIINCTVHGSGSAIITVNRGANDASISNCALRNSGQQNPRLGFGIFVAGAHRTRITNCTLLNIRSTAIHIREGSTYPLVEKNIIINARRGISFGNDNANRKALPDWMDYSPVIDNHCNWFTSENPNCFSVMHGLARDNILSNIEGYGVGFAGTFNCSVIHNTLHRVANADYGAFYLTALQLWKNVSFSPMVRNENFTIVNNIVDIRGTSRRPLFFLEPATSWDSTAVTVSAMLATTGMINGNVYWKPSPPPLEAVRYPENFLTRYPHSLSRANSNVTLFVVRGAAIPQMTFSQWKSAFNFDSASLFGDPLFNGNTPLVLSTSSPAYAAAMTSMSFASSLDLFDSSRGSSPDIGAAQITLAANTSLAIRVNFSHIGLDFASPGSCISEPSALPFCDGINCWHPWLRTAAPTALNLSTVMGTCLNGGMMFPAGHGLNRDISHDPVDAMSDAYLAAMGTMGGAQLHPDFGTVYDGYLMGIPFVLLKGSAYKKVNVRFRYSGESDEGTWPVPEHAPIEAGDCDSIGDRHLIVLDVETCKLYELFKTVYISPEYRLWLSVALTADSGVIFDLHSTEYRKLGYTSADAAGLSVFAALVFQDEINLGAVKHAVRFSVAKSQAAYLFPPATHFASTSLQANLPPMGMRVRLKSWYNCSANVHGSPPTKTYFVICQAAKKYGLIVADNGGTWFVTGSSDSRWDDAAVGQLYHIPTSAFDVVNSGAKMCRTSTCN